MRFTLNSKGYNYGKVNEYRPLVPSTESLPPAAHE
jgi:hypothetical protein